MQSKLLLLVVVGLVLSVGGYVFSQPKVMEGEPLKIGAIFALSGNAAQYGEWARNAVELAVREVNENGGINRRMVTVLYEDNEGQAAPAVSAYRKLTDTDDVRYVLTFQSSVALAVAPLANADKILQMDVSATTPNYSTPDDFTFRTGIVANQLGVEAARYLSSAADTGKLAVLYINNDFGVGMRDIFRENYDGDIAAEEAFAQDSFDFRTPLAKVGAVGADTVFLVGHLREAGTLVKQARELGVRTRFFSDIYAIEGSDFLDAAGDVADGVRYLAPKFDASDAARGVAVFVKKYQEIYGEEPNVFAAQAYDGITVLLRAMEGCEYENTECVRQNLHDIDFEGASGRIVFDINGDTEKPVQLKAVRNRAFIVEPR